MALEKSFASGFLTAFPHYARPQLKTLLLSCVLTGCLGIAGFFALKSSGFSRLLLASYLTASFHHAPLAAQDPVAELGLNGLPVHRGFVGFFALESFATGFLTAS